MWRIGHYINGSFEAIGRFGQQAQAEIISYRYVLDTSVYGIYSANALINMGLGPGRRHRRARWNSKRNPSVL